MQDEKNRTTPEQKTSGKRRRRRKKNGTPAAASVKSTATVQSEENKTETKPAETEEPKAEAQKADLSPEKKAAAAAQGETAEKTTAPEASEKMAPEQPETPEAPEAGEPAEPTEASVPLEEEPASEEKPDGPEGTPQSEEESPSEKEASAAEDGKPEEPPATEEQPETTEEPHSAETPEETAPEPEAAAMPGETDTQEETAEENGGAQDEEEPDKNADGTPESEEETDVAGSAEEEPEQEEELPEEDEKRLSDLTRTVQLSVEQIMSRVSEEEAESEGETAPTDSVPPEDAESEEGPATLRDHLRSGLSGMAKWLLLVLFVVLVIAGFGVAWLYRSATPDMLPQITVKFAGQELEPTAYKWKVPVIGNIFKRTYADTLSSTPVTLEETVEQASPDFVVSPSDYRTELTVTDEAENVIFEGDTDTFTAFQFTANGTYTAKLVVYSDASSVPGDTSVTGSETWQFNFTVGVRPSVTISGTSATQGSVVAVRVGDTLDGQAPTIETELENMGFFKASSGWVCYLPIPWNQAAGAQTVVVHAGGYTETLELNIRAAGWEYKDYSTNSQRVSPYIGQNDIPAELQKLLTQSEKTIAWSNGNFVQPFLNTLDVELAFGTTEYVGRSYNERSSNNGTGGRTATNVVLNTKSGELLIAPASGKVLLAKDLGGDFGYTLVIDHGAGVKSIFYNLQKVDVKAGESVKQGQTLATCGRTTVAEMRIGTVPVDPLQIWRGQCDALKYY